MGTVARKTALIISVFAALSVFPAHGAMIDPAPIFTVIPESPHYKPLLLGKSTDFFCPLFKHFYNDPEEIAVQTLILEAVGEGYDGMVAVGEVIRNRSKLFLRDSRGVCLMPRQFSCWNDEEKAKKFLRKYHKYYFMALAAWKASETSSSTSGATDYHTDAIHPYWADAYQVAAKIGSHIFYVRK